MAGQFCYRQHIQSKIISCQIALAFKSAMQFDRMAGVKQGTIQEPENHSCAHAHTQKDTRARHTHTHTHFPLLLSAQTWNNEILILHRLWAVVNLRTSKEREKFSFVSNCSAYCVNILQLRWPPGLLGFTRKQSGFTRHGWYRTVWWRYGVNYHTPFDG